MTPTRRQFLKLTAAGAAAVASITALFTKPQKADSGSFTNVGAGGTVTIEFPAATRGQQFWLSEDGESYRFNGGGSLTKIKAAGP